MTNMRKTIGYLINSQFERNDDQLATVTLDCGYCCKPIELKAPLSQWRTWIDGELCQDAFPAFDADQREMLISETCGDCWRLRWGDELRSLDVEPPLTIDEA